MEILSKVSFLNTYHFQNSLPKLCIPTLEKSCQRYLEALYPILNKKTFLASEKIVKEFLKNDGRVLDAHIRRLDKRNKSTSYVSAPWFDVYLKDRRPLPINFNPFLGISDPLDPSFNQQLIRATNLTYSALRFRNSLKKHVLQPDVFSVKHKHIQDSLPYQYLCSLTPKQFSSYASYLCKAYPLDMSQYYHLFNSSRIPLRNRDAIVHKEGRHIIVACKGRFYCFDVVNADESLIDANKLYEVYKRITTSKKSVSKVPFGLFTTLNRDTWASIRSSLIKFDAYVNQRILDAIDSSIMIVCLDSNTEDIKDQTSLAANFLHSDGTNRWFDKPIQLIVGSDGKAAINMEHAWGDGVCVLRFINEIYHDSVTRPVISPYTIHAYQNVSIDIPPTKLQLHMSDEHKYALQVAKEEFKTATTCLHLSGKFYSSLNRCVIRKCGLSPDAVMQLAINMAYFRIKKHLTSTYESCSTAAFKHGRTEVVRSATSQVLNFCNAMYSSSRDNLSRNDLKILLYSCSNKHRSLIYEAATGNGFDRHLFMLKYVNEEEDITKSTPKIFEDPSYAYLNSNILSISTLESDAINCGGFGPVNPNGLGVGYFVKNKDIGILTSSFNTDINATDFVDCVLECLDAIKDVVM